MSILSKTIRVSALSCLLLFFLAGIGFGADLIAPTRSLDEPGQSWGRLAVFSEPPELDVFLNGKRVGQTPVWLEKVMVGVYTLKVGEAETETTVKENKSVKIGLFKGSFVAFPEREEEAKQTAAETKGPDQHRKREPGQEERRAEDLTMWEAIRGGASIPFLDPKE